MAEDVFGIVGTVQGGSFRVEQVVAEGGFAVVYRAYHGAFRASVALKCLKVPGSLTQAEQAQFLEQFREEAELLFRLSAALPNVVRPLHVGTLNSVARFVPFIAIEWLDGRTLDQMVGDRALNGEPPMPLARVMDLLGPAAAALDKAHHFPGPNGAVSIVHCDLKPENVFVANVHGEEVPKILDFGIAKVKSAATQAVGRQSARQTALSAFTPAYGAPEQWLPKRFGQTGPWTDVWGLALTAVECLCGHSPIDGDQAAMMGSAIDPERRPTPRSEGVSVSDAVEAVFARALAVDPRDRFHTVGEFWQELCRAAGDDRVCEQAFINSSPRFVREAATQRQVPDLVVAPRADSRRSHEALPAPRSAPVRQPTPGAVPDALNAMFGTTIESLDDDLEPAGSAVALDTMDGVGVGALPPRSLRAARPAAGPRRAQRERLDIAGPVQMLLIAVALMGLDWLYATFSGSALRFGPARMLWVAGPLAILGAVLLVSRLLSHDA